MALKGLRPEIQIFAGAMEERLRANDYQGHGNDGNVLGYLFPRLIEEIGELGKQLTMHGGADTRVTLRRAADAANLVMMIAGACGALTH